MQIEFFGAFGVIDGNCHACGTAADGVDTLGGMAAAGLHLALTIFG